MIGGLQLGLAGGAIAIMAGLGAYAWDADRALRREHDRAQAATMQRDQFAKSFNQCRLEIAEKNTIINRMAALPADRLRLCVQRAPTDGCCRPAPAECRP